MINIINPDQFIRENKLKGPVLSPQFYFGNSNSFHSQGLYSEDIFGVEGSVERKSSMSWVELNCNVINPVLYDILQKRIFKNIDALISGRMQFRIDESGSLVEDMEGEINGLSSLFENIDRIKFKPGEDTEGDRNKIISVMYKNIKNRTFFMNKCLIISPEVRPIVVLEDTNEVRVDPLSNIYKKIIMASNHVKGVAGSLYDILSYNIQMILRELYEYIKIKVSKKSGMIRNLMLGKRVDFSARAVVVPDPTVTLGELGVPLRIICQIFEPFMIYGIANSPYSKSIPQSFHDEVKKFLKNESILEIM